MKKIWVTIEGYENYSVSNFGEVMSLKNNRILNKIKDKGYRFVCLRKNGYTKNLRIHRLVALNFIKNPSKKRCVNHIDSDILNNKLENLEWVTHKENTQHSLKAGRMGKKGINIGVLNSNSKLNNDKVSDIRHKYSTKKYTMISLAKLFNVSRSCIFCVIHKKNWANIID